MSLLEHFEAENIPLASERLVNIHEYRYCSDEDGRVRFSSAKNMGLIHFLCVQESDPATGLSQAIAHDNNRYHVSLGNDKTPSQTSCPSYLIED